jgi:hypothetical protein
VTLFFFIFKYGPEVKPSIEPLVLILRVNEVKEILLFEISELDVARTTLVVEVNNFLSPLMLSVVVVWCHQHFLFVRRDDYFINI